MLHKQKVKELFSVTIMKQIINFTSFIVINFLKHLMPSEKYGWVGTHEPSMPK
jgi:hypothetical protein